MTKMFYDQIISVREIHTELDKYEMSIEEREEIISLTNQHIHHHVLNVILTKLPKEKHEAFLQSFHLAPDDVELLKSLGKEIEDEIKKVAETVKKEILGEIKRANKK